MMVPKPSESEKKACPRAAAKAWASIFEKSGLKRYSTPFPAPGRVSEYTAMAITMKNSIGIITLLNFSIPSLMPTITMTVVATMKTVCMMSGAHGAETKFMNMPFIAPCDSLPVNENVTDLMKYSMDQPPITL